MVLLVVGEALPVSLPYMLLHRVGEDLRVVLERQVEAPMEMVRRSRPEDGSEEEQRVVAAFTRALFNVRLALGSDVVDRFHEDVSGSLDALLLREYGSAEVRQKLAYHHLVRSTEVLGRVFRMYHRAAPLLGVAMGDRRTGRSDAAPVLEEEIPELLRGELGVYLTNALLLFVSVALEVSGGELEEFAYWAKRSVECSRALEATLPHLARNLDELTVDHRGEPRSERRTAPPRRVPGGWKGRVEIADDFDDPLPKDVEDSFYRSQL